jgi:autotransporter passenger strand-loop-strand repeat protein
VVNGKGSFDFVVGKTFGDVINNGTEFVVSGGFASGTTVNSGGVEAVYGSGSEAEFATIEPGGTEVISAGGVDAAALVGGVQFVLAGAAAGGAMVEGGGSKLSKQAASPSVPASLASLALPGRPISRR